MLKRQILEDLKKAVEGLGYKSSDIVCTIPKNPQFGDYSTNVALQLAKLNSEKNKQNAIEIANQISQKLKSFDSAQDNFYEIKVAGNGFINFFIKPEKISEDLQTILSSGEDYGKSEIGKGKEARVEFISANPTGPLHIGNARSGPLGDVIASVLEASGYKVLREFIDNNVGEQIKVLGATIKATYHANVSAENQYKGEYILELVKQLQEEIEGKDDEEVGLMAVELLHKEILNDAHSMGIKFDLVVHESDLRKRAPQIIAELKQAGVVKAKDGALWLAPSDEFLKDRETVIEKSNGNYTYFTSDIVYHKMKFATGADLIIDVFGSNHHGHVPRLQAAVQALGFDPQKLKVVLYQYVRVKRGLDIVKMSKRAGDFVTAREVLDEVGKDAFRFYLLKFSPQTHMDFDLEILKLQSKDNPVYYVQYAHARMSNILVKGRDENLQVDFNLLIDSHETALIKHLLILPDLILELSSTFQVHQLTDYAISLADYFHKFYESCPVLTAENKELIQARIILVKAARVTLANTLKILGVSAPVKM